MSIELRRMLEERLGIRITNPNQLKMVAEMDGQLTSEFMRQCRICGRWHSPLCSARPEPDETGN